MPATAKKKPAAKKVNKPAAKPAAKKVKHPTVEEVAASSARYGVMDLVAAGCTIGEVVESFGNPGLKNVARHVRFGRYQIVGIKPDQNPHLDPIADATLAAKLAKMKPATLIKELVAPPRRT